MTDLVVVEQSQLIPFKGFFEELTLQVNLSEFIRKLKAKAKKQPVQRSVGSNLDRNGKSKLLVANKT